MKKIFLVAAVIFYLPLFINAQKIIPILHDGKKYEVLDMTSKGKIMWGGYEEIALEAAKSETDGLANTKAIVIAVGKNSGFDGKLYAAKLCSEAKMEVRKTGTCHQKLKQKLFMGLRISLM